MLQPTYNRILDNLLEARYQFGNIPKKDEIDCKVINLLDEVIGAMKYEHRLRLKNND